MVVDEEDEVEAGTETALPVAPPGTVREGTVLVADELLPPPQEASPIAARAPAKHVADASARLRVRLPGDIRLRPVRACGCKSDRR